MRIVVAEREGGQTNGRTNLQQPPNMSPSVVAQSETTPRESPRRMSLALALMVHRWRVSRSLSQRTSSRGPGVDAEAEEKVVVVGEQEEMGH